MDNEQDQDFRIQFADEQLRHQVNNFHKKSLRSRSWDGRKSTENQIELRSRIQSTNKELLGSFFKYYIMSVIKKNEELNISYLEKLKMEYSKLHKG